MSTTILAAVRRELGMSGKIADAPKAGLIEALPKLGAQIVGQLGYQMVAIACLGAPALLLLHVSAENGYLERRHPLLAIYQHLLALR